MFICCTLIHYSETTAWDSNIYNIDCSGKSSTAVDTSVSFDRWQQGEKAVASVVVVLSP